jgi:hypothetical protein
MHCELKIKEKERPYFKALSQHYVELLRKSTDKLK